MSARNAKRTVGLLAVVMFFAGSAVLNGRKQSEKEQAPVGDEAERTSAQGTMEPKELVAAASTEILQETCPVMEGPINEDIYVEYKGKKVYFCCEGCVEAFKKEPKEYLAKLPQFRD
jgi:hypothetical protein